MAEAKLIVNESLELLAHHDFHSLIRSSFIKEDIPEDVLILIQLLNLRPEQAINTCYRVCNSWGAGTQTSILLGSGT
ncbi:MAG: hypothetical protein ACSLEL_01525 [Candidatus Malihini olakiniferum]